MALQHLSSGTRISVAPLGADITAAKTSALFKGQHLEVARVVLLAGKHMREHTAPGEITLQCLEGQLELRTPDATQVLEQGDFVHLDAGVPHALMAHTNASALVTMVIARA